MLDWREAEEKRELATTMILNEFKNCVEAYSSSHYIEKIVFSGPTCETGIWDEFLPPGIGTRIIHDTKTFKVGINLSDHSQGHLLEPTIKKIGEDSIDIQIIGNVCAQSATLNYRRYRPLRLGSSISRSEMWANAGTLGCFVQKKDNSSDLMILSCNHVLLDRNRGQIGDPILQPAIEDKGIDYTDQIAILQEFIPLKPVEDLSELGAGNQNNLNNHKSAVDAAIAKVTCNDVNSLKNQISDQHRLNGFYTSEELFDILQADSNHPIKQSGVWKLGRVSGLTKGLINTINEQASINYKGPMRCKYTNLIIFEGANDEPFSQPGDSGSIIIDERGYAVALLIGGSRRGGKNNRGLTYALPIDIVLESLNIELAL